jgi:hypothetical protein
MLNIGNTVVIFPDKIAPISRTPFLTRVEDRALAGDSPLVGKYKVSVYTSAPNVGALATNARYKIVAEHETQRVMVNQQQGAGQWHLLGTFDNPRLSNAANGIVVADAVRFERIE